MFSGKTLYHFFSRAILVVLCPVFFSVQIFFNFGVAGNSGLYNNHVLGTSVVKNQRPAGSATRTAQHQTGFRLNKHFQPESLAPYQPLVIESPLEYLDCAIYPTRSIHFFSSPLLEQQSLRGPPRKNDFS